MQIKEIKAINFLFYRVETKVSELSQYAMVGQELFAEAVQNKLFITGPVHWHYLGFEGDVNKNFILEISLPVSDVLENYDGRFHFKRTNSFKCLSTIHEGAWHEIPNTYGKLMQFIAENNLIPIASNREVYINVDLKNPDANTTEIQMGIK